MGWAKFSSELDRNNHKKIKKKWASIKNQLIKKMWARIKREFDTFKKFKKLTERLLKINTGKRRQQLSKSEVANLKFNQITRRLYHHHIQQRKKRNSCTNHDS